MADIKSAEPPRATTKRSKPDTEDDDDLDIDSKFGSGASIKKTKAASSKTDTSTSKPSTTTTSNDPSDAAPKPKKPKKDKDRDKSRDKDKTKTPKPPLPSSNQPMILVTVNDRLGTKAQIPCLASDPVALFKKQVAARIGRQPHEILLKRQGERPFKDGLTLEDYGVSNGVQLDLELDTGD